MPEKKEKQTPYDTLTDEQKREPMPYYQHAIEMARVMLQAKRWFIFCMVLLSLFVLTNAGWIIRETMYQTYYLEQEVDTGNGDAYVAGIGDVNYGQSETENQNPGKEK